MSETITVALISGICVVASALITGAISKNQFSMELDKRIAVMQTQMSAMTSDIQELTDEVRTHNSFGTRIAVIESQIRELKGGHANG
jgi:type II secretory pathway component PulJ